MDPNFNLRVRKSSKFGRTKAGSTPFNKHERATTHHHEEGRVVLLACPHFARDDVGGIRTRGLRKNPLREAGSVDYLCPIMSCRQLGWHWASEQYLTFQSHATRI